MASTNDTDTVLLYVLCLGALADNNRLPKAPGVIKAFGTIMSAYRGEVTCVVTTAKV